MATIEPKIEGSGRKWFVRYVNPFGTEVKLGPFASRRKAEAFGVEQVKLYADGR